MYWGARAWEYCVYVHMGILCVRVYWVCACVSPFTCWGWAWGGSVHVTVPSYLSNIANSTCYIRWGFPLPSSLEFPKHTWFVGCSAMFLQIKPAQERPRQTPGRTTAQCCPNIPSITPSYHWMDLLAAGKPGLIARSKQQWGRLSETELSVVRRLRTSQGRTGSDGWKQFHTLEGMVACTVSLGVSQSISIS